MPIDTTESPSLTVKPGAKIGIFSQADWWRPVLLAAALFSSAIIFLLWDGSMQRIVEKGLLGLLISVVILVAILLLKWPAAEF